MKLNKITRKRKDVNDMEVEAPETMKPRFDLEGDDLPAIDDWDVGEKYMVVMEVEMISMRKGSEWGETDNKTRATFRIHQVGEYEEKKKSNTVSNEEYAEAMNQARS